MSVFQTFALEYAFTGDGVSPSISIDLLNFPGNSNNVQPGEVFDLKGALPVGVLRASGPTGTTVTAVLNKNILTLTFSPPLPNDGVEHNALVVFEFSGV